MAALNVGPLLSATLVVAHVNAHVARRAFLFAACAIVVVQADELASISLGHAVRWHGLQQVLHRFTTRFTCLAELVLVTATRASSTWPFGVGPRLSGAAGAVGFGPAFACPPEGKGVMKHKI